MLKEKVKEKWGMDRIATNSLQQTDQKMLGTDDAVEVPLPEAFR
jgi:hypothetical protein